MAEIPKDKRVPWNRNGKHGIVDKAPSRQVYLTCRGPDVNGVGVDADLYDKEAWDSDGKIPIALEISCPRCAQRLNMSAASDPPKPVEVEYIDPPRKITLVDGQVAYQTARVSVEVPCQCPWPAQSGKGLCGFQFKITDNVLHRL